MPKLHLYVFNDVLSDYTPGIAFAIAPSVSEARELIFDQLGRRDKDIEIAEPTIYELDAPMAEYCFGGG